MRAHRGKTENGRIRRRASLAGWFVNCQEFSQPDLLLQHSAECSSLRLVTADICLVLSERADGVQNQASFRSAAMLNSV